jgi:tripartite-type tricarboxylate transporter receptor subunit TctC
MADCRTPPRPLDTVHRRRCLQRLAGWSAASLLAGGPLALPRAAHAQDYPVKPIRLIVPFAPGGSSDTVSRLVAQKLSAALGQQVVLENRAGAGGNIGMDAVAKAAPDGYTLLFAAGSAAINVSLYDKMPFDPLKDLVPVSHVCNVNGILVVHPSVPARTLKEFIDLARSRPDAINYASAGSGTVVHLAGEMFKSMARVNLTHVPYKGSGPALSDLLGGQVQAMFANMPGTMQHVKADKLRVLAVTGARRSPLLPDVPAVSELVPGYAASTWFGVFAPAGTPAAIVTRINAEIGKALTAPDLLATLRAEGAEPVGSSAEQFAQFFREEVSRWGAVVRASGARAN